MNYPPLHVFCRATTIAHIPDDYMKDISEKEFKEFERQTFAEWKKSNRQHLTIVECYLFMKEVENGKGNFKCIFDVAYIDFCNGKGIRVQYDELVLGVFAYSNPVVTRSYSYLHCMRGVCVEVLIYEIETLITQVIGFLFCPGLEGIKS